MVRASTHPPARLCTDIELAAHGSTHLYDVLRHCPLQVRGRDSLSAEDLLGCFDFAPGRSGAAGAMVSGFLREVVASVLDEQQRWKLLRWATSRSTLPVNGLGQKVTLIRRDTDGAPPDQWLPEAHTCSLEIALPDYSSRPALSEQLSRALEEMDAGGGFGLR